MDKLDIIRNGFAGEKLRWEDFPDIGLYMDQVLLILSRNGGAFSGQEKLTPAMVNNYIKDGHIPRANGKKYSREHLAYLTVFTHLKHVLSVSDAGKLTGEILSEDDIEEGFDSFAAELKSAEEALILRLEEDSNEDTVMTALRLALAAYVAKAACEELISDNMEKE
ncbi:MAG: DUF1836 domain-containing protein [Eubacteriales bacterium]|nr:DUF1836 domain-containing protein [Eubacteriales bacterium]